MGARYPLILCSESRSLTLSSSTDHSPRQGGAAPVDRPLGLGQQFQGSRGEEDGTVREAGRAAGDLCDQGLTTYNLPVEIGCGGVVNKKKHLVLETIGNLVKIRGRKRLKAALGRITLLGSYRIWLARHSQQWTGREMIK